MIEDITAYRALQHFSSEMNREIGAGQRSASF
jgi:hypothetical protein